MSDNKDPKIEKVAGSESTEKKGFMSKLVHGVGTLIQGSVVASDKALDFARATKEKSSHGTLAGNRKKKKQKREKKLSAMLPLFNNRESHFTEEQKKELTLILEQRLSEMEREDEYEGDTNEQDEDDGYFGITDPGLTAPTMTMGLRNSFGDFFGNTADAMEAHEKDIEKRNSIYR